MNQTTVSVTTNSETDRISESNVAVAHDRISLAEVSITPNSAPITYNIKEHRNVLDVLSSPLSLLRMSFDGGSDIVSSRMIVMAHNLSSLSLSTEGAIVGSAQIESMTSNQDGTLTIGLSGHPFNNTTLTGNATYGPYSLEGEYFYFILGDYSEQKVYLIDVGVLDANGDRYVYDGTSAMRETEEIDGVQYGAYVAPSAAIVAEAMERCINALFDTTVVLVEYDTDLRAFVITCTIPSVSSMSIPVDYEGVQDILGFGISQSLSPAYDSTGLKAYIEGIGVCDMTIATRESITVSEVMPSPPLPTKVYFIDQDQAVRVKIFDV